ncbi:MAG: hypothetical protein KatS3mg097_297 [Candidatus Parcubacteria bacterium]|nr:MAG: hypothetical protein KatS3mg097_297 [Candidatus Parcubacteria bacterium]
MLKRIEKGEANEILNWYPNHLTRNSINVGKIIYMIDKGLVKSLKFPTFSLNQCYKDYLCFKLLLSKANIASIIFHNF